MSHKLCTLSRGMRVQADSLIDEVKGHAYDVVVLPGGMPGAKHLADSPSLIEMLETQKNRGAWYAAICASPAVVFKGRGICTSEKMVCYDYKDFTDPLIEAGQLGEGRVAISGKCITSVGPSSALDFGLAIVESLVGKAKADQIAKEMMMTSRCEISRY
jgi:protein deglycase